VPRSGRGLASRELRREQPDTNKALPAGSAFFVVRFHSAADGAYRGQKYCGGNSQLRRALAGPDKRPMRRRTFLIAVGATIVAPAWAEAAPVPERRLRLIHGDTNETIDAVFRNSDGAVNEEALLALSEFLRDRHVDEIKTYEPAVLDFLWESLDQVDRDRATVLSGYRTHETNEKLRHSKIGVAEGSQHLFGRAIDVYVEGRVDKMAKAARSMRRGGVGWYPQNKFVHLDVGPVRDWTMGGVLPANLGFKNLLAPGVSQFKGPYNKQQRIDIGHALAKLQYQQRMRGLFYPK
jgi:uncharacterized protein YcbK (DUF882 family)